MNNELYFDLICLKAVLAQIFTSLRLVTCLRLVWLQMPFSFMNNTKSLYPRCPLWPNNLLNPRNPWLIISVIRVNSWLNQNMKTKPKQSQTKPIFWRPNPILSQKTRIFDKFRTTFLCKTKPIYFCPAPTLVNAAAL